MNFLQFFVLYFTCLIGPYLAMESLPQKTAIYLKIYIHSQGLHRSLKSRAHHLQILMPKSLTFSVIPDRLNWVESKPRAKDWGWHWWLSSAESVRALNFIMVVWVGSLATAFLTSSQGRPELFVLVPALSNETQNNHTFSSSASLPLRWAPLSTKDISG